MTLELLIRALGAQRRGGLIWALCLVALAGSVVALWPSMSESGSLDAMVEGLSPELVSALGLANLGSPVGFLTGNLYALALPLAFCALGILHMTALTAGDEDAGRLELLLALPVGRTRVYLTRVLAVAIVLALVSLAVGAVVGFGGAAFDMDLDGEGVAAVTVALFGLALFHAALAFGLAGVGLRAPAVSGASFGVLGAGYLAHAVLPLVKDFEDAALASPWEWALGEHPLKNGFDAPGLAALAAGVVVFVAIGLIAVRRRTIRTA